MMEAKQLAQDLNSGALPVPVSPVSQQTIGPTLGAESLAAGIQAALIGFVLVSLFMVVYYRLPGLLAVVSLVFYAAANLVLFRLFGVTMTLSGIAGFAFSFGIAVDANVLVFERLKEELRSGRDLVTAVDEAFRRAWPSVRDGNVTTLIATAVLYTMSTGFIRGFALTLTIGVLMSMFSAFGLTKALMQTLAVKKSLKKARYILGAPRA
jgi:preprotein translocase subunit SecD